MLEEEENEPGSSSQEQQKKPSKKGIIFLSSIPPYMNVSQIREYFGQFGTLGRVYLQLAEKETKNGEKKKRKTAKKFTEGWVEFDKKSAAKKVAKLINNSQVSSRKKSKHFDITWNLKYLSNFKWAHLHERLAYEKAARRQKLRAEIQLAKKKTNFFTVNLDKKNKSLINKKVISSSVTKKVADDQVVNTEERNDFLKSLFS